MLNRKDATRRMRLRRELQRLDHKRRRSHRPPARDAAHVASGKPRRNRDKARLQYVRRAPCLCCLIEGRLQRGPTRAAHVRAGYSEAGWPPTGMGQKPSDTRTLGLCDFCHIDGRHAQHRGGERAFWARLGVYPPEACALFDQGYAAGADPTEIAQRIACEAVALRAQRLSKCMTEDGEIDMGPLTTLQRALLGQADGAPDRSCDTPVEGEQAVADLIKRGLMRPTPENPERVALTEAGRVWARAIAEPALAPESPPPEARPEPTGKIASLIALLRRPEGATIDVLRAVLGWQAHSIRGAISGELRKKRRLNVISEMVDGARVYRIGI